MIFIAIIHFKHGVSYYLIVIIKKKKFNEIPTMIYKFKQSTK